MSSALIIECLVGTLSSDANTRISAELKLAELLALPDASLALSQLILAQSAEMPLRQMSCTFSSIVLRKYVTERWSPFFSTFKGSAPPVEVKSQLRLAISQGLSDPSRKIRSLCAQIMSLIATCDWPDEYPELLSFLIELISSNSPDSVHGAMQVFTEFIKSELTEDQILPVLRQLLPVLLGILGSSEQHSPLTRARSISVFRQCVTSLYMVKDQHPQAVKETTASILPVWLDAFKVLLNMDPQQDVGGANWDGLAIRAQVFKTLDTIYVSFPRTLMPYLRDFLSSSLNHLRGLSAAFSHYYLTALDAVPSSSEDEPISLPQLLCSILDFISASARGGKAKDWFELSNLDALITLVFHYSQITNDDEETWAIDANAFIAQEEDEAQPYSVRVASFDLVACLLERSPAKVTASLHSSLQQTVHMSHMARNAGNNNWWRPLEAALAVVGSQAEDILEYMEEEEDAGRPKPIDIDNLLAEVIPSLLSLAGFPFLRGRACVIASQYAKRLPSQLASQYFDAAVQVIEDPDAGIPVKLSAVKAIHNFCVGVDGAVLVPYAERIVKDLGPFLLMASEDTLSLVLETLSVALEVDEGKWLTPDLSYSLVTAVLEIWAKNNKDPIFNSILSDILGTLAKAHVSGIYEVVMKQALPPLCHSIDSAPPTESWVPASAIELVSSLVKGSPDSGLGEGCFALLAPSLFKCLSTTEDRDVLQNGVACLTLVIRKDCSQLLSWSDASGRSGLDNVLSVIAKLLRSQDESGGLAIGDLIIHLLRKAGDSVLSVLPELLQAMIARMTTAKTATFLQSLVIPFAFLIHNQLDTVLSLLEQTAVQDRSALDILIQTWCENAEVFQGFWPSRISDLTLSQLYVSERPSLQHLMVKGDIIVKPETRNVIMTRSRTKQTPHEFTSIPFPVKILKILLHEIQSGGDAATISAQDTNIDVDSDDGDEEWAEEEEPAQSTKEDQFAYVSELIGPKGMAFDNDDVLNVTDDEDLKSDPVSQMDMQAHLLAFFRECAARNTGNFSAMVEQMKTEEMMVVRRIISM